MGEHLEGSGSKGRTKSSALWSWKCKYATFPQAFSNSGQVREKVLGVLVLLLCLVCQKQRYTEP